MNGFEKILIGISLPYTFVFHFLFVLFLKKRTKKSKRPNQCQRQNPSPRGRFIPSPPVYNFVESATGKVYGKKIGIKYLICYLLIGGLMACSPNSPAAHHDHEGHDHDEHGHENHDEEVILTDIQIEKIGIRYGKMEKKPMRDKLIVNGVAALMPQKQAQASSLLGGRIERILVQPGKQVKKGEKLVVIKNPDLIDLQQDLEEVTASLLYLDREFERRKELLADSVIALESFQRITSDRAQALARQRGMRAKLKAFGLTPSSESFQDEIVVRAPIAGYVDEVLAANGSFAEAMQPLVSILQSDQTHLELKLFEQDIDKVEVGQQITFSLAHQAHKSYRAQVFAVDQMLEPSDRSLVVFARPSQAIDNLLPGMYVTAELGLSEKQLMAVPLEAIAKDRALAYIFIKEHDEAGEVHFKKIEVDIGQQDQGFVAIEPMKNFPDDAEIVFSNAFYLLAQSKKGEEVPGHSH